MIESDKVSDLYKSKFLSLGVTLTGLRNNVDLWHQEYDPFIGWVDIEPLRWRTTIEWRYDSGAGLTYEVTIERFKNDEKTIMEMYEEVYKLITQMITAK